MRAAAPGEGMDANTVVATVSQATFVNRQALHLRPDPARVIVRPFKPATEPRDLNPTDKMRANHIVQRVLALDQETVAAPLADALENFEGRHRNLLERLEARADEMEDAFARACFLNEYSFEASALFNPSIVAHPDQSGAPKGGVRFIVSLGVIGEGHVSSLTFRTGTIAADGGLAVDPTARLASSPRICHRVSGPDGELVELVSKPEEDLTERVIFPVTETQSQQLVVAPMARVTTYVIQAFNAGKGGGLKPDSPIVCKSESGALRTAEGLTLSKLAVVAFSSTGDPEIGDYDDKPTVLFRKGELPVAFD